MIMLKLTELIEALECHPDLGESLINLKTGEIFFISEEALHFAEDENDSDHSYSDWQKEDIETAKHYLQNPDDYLALPSQHEVNEYQMMQDFISTLVDGKIAGQLLITLQGRGAFRRFKDSVNLLGIAQEWYAFKNERYKQFVIEWCNENAITLLQT